MTLEEIIRGLQEMELSLESLTDAEIEIRTPHCGKFQVTNLAWQNKKVVLWCE